MIKDARANKALVAPEEGVVVLAIGVQRDPRRVRDLGALELADDVVLGDGGEGAGDPRVQRRQTRRPGKAREWADFNGGVQAIDLGMRDADELLQAAEDRIVLVAADLLVLVIVVEECGVELDATIQQRRLDPALVGVEPLLRDGLVLGRGGGADVGDLAGLVAAARARVKQRTAAGHLIVEREAPGHVVLVELLGDGRGREAGVQHQARALRHRRVGRLA